MVRSTKIGKGPLAPQYVQANKALLAETIAVKSNSLVKHIKVWHPT